MTWRVVGPDGEALDEGITAHSATEALAISEQKSKAAGAWWPSNAIAVLETQATTSMSLGDEYPKEQARLRELVEQYRTIGWVGSFGRAEIERILRAAEEASAAGDLVAMIHCFKAMRGCK